MRTILDRLLNIGIFSGFVATALLVVIAYQFRPGYDITIGSATDAPLLRDFHAGEVMSATTPIPFRWSAGLSEIVLQDVGRQDLDVALTVSGWRPPGQAQPELEISSGGTVLLKENPPPEFSDYRFRVPRELLNDGTLRLTLLTNAFTPSGDSRPLGVVVSRLRVAPAPNPDRFIEPPINILFALLGASALLGVTLALLGWGAGVVGLGSALPGLLGAALLVFDRFWLTSQSWYESWPQVILAGAILVCFLRLARWLLSGRFGGERFVLDDRFLLTLLFAAFVVRLAGQLHPQIFIVDLKFHQHRFETVEAGTLLFTIKSAEWGGRPTFYLPTSYLFMLPLQWLLNDKLLMVRLFTVAVSSLGIVPLAYLVRRATGSLVASRFAATLYVTMPISVLVFSWGITTNLFGEFFALCALAIAAGAYDKLRPGGLYFYLLLPCLLLALLSHPGVVQLTVGAFLMIGVIWLAARRIVVSRRGGLLTLAALMLAVTLSFGLYYRNVAAEMLRTYGEIRAERAAEAGASGSRMQIGGSVGDKSLGLIVRKVESRQEWLTGGLRGFWQEAHAYYRVWPLLGAALGYALLLTRRGGSHRRSNRHGGRLALAALGWAGAVIAFALIGWVLNLYVRYMLFALPVVAAGAGILLARIGRISRVAMLLSLMILVFFAVEALGLWQYRINYAFK